MRMDQSWWLVVDTTSCAGTSDYATLTEIKYKVNVNTMEQCNRELALNDIGRVTLSLDEPIPFTPTPLPRPRLLHFGGSFH